MALYNKKRPNRYEEIWGQETAIRILKNGYEKKRDDYPQCSIFIGPHGTGKTTAARILAKVLNCEHPEGGEPCCKCSSCISIQKGTSPSVIELDAASNNGVESARSIIEQAQYVPVGKKRVFILDEVQMLSNAAWNAFLKTFEEPPKDVYFILCTTEALKVSATANSRCQEVIFHSISEETIAKRLKALCAEEKIEIEEDALKLLARLSNGHMRDAISDLEKYAAFEKITKEVILEDKGITDSDSVMYILESVLTGNGDSAFKVLRELRSKGKDIKKLCGLMIETLTAVLTGDVTMEGVCLSDVVLLQKELVNAYPLLSQPLASFYLDAVLSVTLKGESIMSSLEKDVKMLKERPVVVTAGVSEPTDEKTPDEVSGEEFIKAAMELVSFGSANAEAVEEPITMVSEGEKASVGEPAMDEPVLEDMPRAEEPVEIPSPVAPVVSSATGDTVGAKDEKTEIKQEVESRAEEEIEEKIAKEEASVNGVPTPIVVSSPQETESPAPSGNNIPVQMVSPDDPRDEIPFEEIGSDGDTISFNQLLRQTGNDVIIPVKVESEENNIVEINFDDFDFFSSTRCAR